MIGWAKHQWSQNVVGYVALALAIIVASVVFQNQQNQQDHFAQQLANQGARSCAALNGAVSFWTDALAANRVLLSDTSRTDIERQANLMMIAALEVVIDRGNGVTRECKP